MRSPILLVLSLLIQAPVIARDAAGEFAVFSVGAEQCSDYLRARQRSGDHIDAYSQWLQGYLSAFNLIVANTYNIVGEHGYPQILAWLDRYCQQKPADRFINAAAVLTLNLYPERQREPSQVDDQWAHNNHFSVNNLPRPPAD